MCHSMCFSLMQSPTHPYKHTEHLSLVIHLMRLLLALLVKTLGNINLGIHKLQLEINWVLRFFINLYFFIGKLTIWLGKKFKLLSWWSCTSPSIKLTSLFLYVSPFSNSAKKSS